MKINRRQAVLSGAAVAGAALIPAVPASASETKTPSKATLKLSSQIRIIPGASLEEKLANMERWGFDSVELFGDVVGNEAKHKKAVGNTKLRVSAICFGSVSGDLVSDVASKRGPAAEKIKAVLASAGELGSTGVIYVPAFNKQTKLGNQEVRKILVDTLPALGEHAAKAGTRLLLEPLNRKEAFFLRQLADAASIARDCNSEGVGVIGDFYHMGIEETSDFGAIVSGGPYIHHMHLASRARVLPGQDNRSFIDGFRGLKWIGFHDYCSLECGVRGKPEEEIPKAVAFLRDQWSRA